MLLAIYLVTLAPGVTFWDAGEFIAAAHGFGIPHPPGTPLYVALGRAWIVLSGWLLGSALAMNVLSAVATAAAGAVTTWLVARETPGGRGTGHAWGAFTGGVTAGLMCTAWASATESEVYSLALLHVAIMLACASRAADEVRDDRWTLVLAYLVALAPALHLSVLVGAPAAIVMATRRRDGGWAVPRMLLLAGATVASAGVGRMSVPLVLAGTVLLAAALWRGAPPRVRPAAGVGQLLLLGASTLAIMLVRARHAPALNQGDPSTWSALADVVARRQYDVGGIWPRNAPAWLQLGNVVQYVDWQVAMAWGRGVFTTLPRVAATLVFVALAVQGWRGMRREAPRLAMTLGTLLLCGTLGVAAYLNLRAGASLGWGVLPDDAPHEARERDYFFVLGFWGWACLAAWGALGLARRAGRPALAAGIILLPLAGNWRAVDRARSPYATAARTVAASLLADAPRRAVLFTSGDNDSYPLWYLQQVERVRTDVQVVTIPLLAAPWYVREVTTRAGLPLPRVDRIEGTRWLHEEVAGAIAAAAMRAGRPVAASPALPARERALLGAGWTLGRAVYVASGPRAGTAPTPDVSPEASRVAALSPRPPRPLRSLPDDVGPSMLDLLECPRLGAPWAGSPGARDSLETRCNFR